MGQPEIRTFPSREALARAAAAQWKAHQLPSKTAGPQTVALSGGRIARDLFSELRHLEIEEPFLENAVEFFWADERCVPPDDPESNFGLAAAELFLPLRIPAGRIHRISGEDPPAMARQRAETELRQVTAALGHEAILDLVLLGMGEDGHVASLFPGNMSKDSDDQGSVYLAVRGPKPPADRITLSYRTIAQAREVWVLASGLGKETALVEALRPEGRTPLATVLKMRRRTLIFTDLQTAAEGS